MPWVCSPSCTGFGFVLDAPSPLPCSVTASMRHCFPETHFPHGDLDVGPETAATCPMVACRPRSEPSRTSDRSKHLTASLVSPTRALQVSSGTSQHTALAHACLRRNSASSKPKPSTLECFCRQSLPYSPPSTHCPCNLLTIMASCLSHSPSSVGSAHPLRTGTLFP